MFPTLVASGLTLLLAAGNQVAAEGGIRGSAAEPPAAKAAAQLRAAVSTPEIGRRLADHPAWTRAEAQGPADAAKVSNIDSCKHLMVAPADIGPSSATVHRQTACAGGP